MGARAVVFGSLTNVLAGGGRRAVGGNVPTISFALISGSSEFPSFLPPFLLLVFELLFLLRFSLPFDDLDRNIRRPAV